MKFRFSFSNITRMSLLRFYDYISLLTTDDSLHQWIAQFAGHRNPVTKKENWLKTARDHMKENIRLINDGGWKEEKVKGSDIIYSRVIENIGKVFKFECILNSNIEKVKEKLFYNVEKGTEWNSSLDYIKVIQEIDNTACITHSTIKRYHMVSSRDFVHLRALSQIDNRCILTCVSIAHPKVPESCSTIRGEHRIFTYIVSPVKADPSKTHFVWMMNLNLKGWLPQTIIDQTLASGMLDHIRDIRSCVEN